MIISEEYKLLAYKRKHFRQEQSIHKISSSQDFSFDLIVPAKSHRKLGEKGMANIYLFHFYSHFVERKTLVYAHEIFAE